jgi:hypothetical protein
MSASILLYVLLAAVAGLAVGLLLGMWRASALGRKLAVAEAELRGHAAHDVEQERMLALAAERLGSAFDDHDQRFHSHGDFPDWRETLGTQTGVRKRSRR